MKKEESLVPKEWFDKADKELKSAEILSGDETLLEVVIYHLQQTVEKYLKGYLLSKRWKLKRVHELDGLLNEAIKHNEKFKNFLSLCQTLSQWYIETKYPFRIRTPIKNSEVRKYIQETKKLIAFIKQL